jgi:FtsH-binding integral membrane protein
MADEPFFNFRNVLILLGLVITTVGLVYFATEFSDVISQWGRVIDLALLTLVYVSLGVHFAATEEGGELVRHKGWRWMRVTTAFYILGIVSGFAGVIAFLAIDELSRVTKLLVTIIVGLALIVVTAWKFGRPKAGAPPSP